jgi:hypothetical protein
MSRRLAWRLFKLSFQVSAALSVELFFAVIRFKRKWTL